MTGLVSTLNVSVLAELLDLLTMRIPVLGHGVDLLVRQDLHVLAAGSAVQLVDSDQPAAHAVRHFALLAYMLREIRRGLIGYLSEIRWHHSQVTFFLRSLVCAFYSSLLSFSNS